MTVRVRETVGTSWPDPGRPGTRHWRSVSVSAGGGWLLAAWVLRYFIAWPLFLGPLWLVAEFWIVAVTGLIVAAALARRQARWADVTLTRLRFGLLMADLR